MSYKQILLKNLIVSILTILTLFGLGLSWIGESVSDEYVKMALIGYIGSWIGISFWIYRWSEKKK